MRSLRTHCCKTIATQKQPSCEKVVQTQKIWMKKGGNEKWWPKKLPACMHMYQF